MTGRALSAKDLDAARAKISQVVEDSVVETFTSMFGQAVTAEGARKMLAEPGQNSVYSAVKLHQGDVHVEFCFHFDFNLLLQAAQLIFTQEYLANNPVHEDLACEIANIVCSKVKAYLNDTGFETEMGFPYIPEKDENHLRRHPEMVHMHFFYDAGGKANKGVGVIVNFFAEDKKPTG